MAKGVVSHDVGSTCFGTIGERIGSSFLFGFIS